MRESDILHVPEKLDADAFPGLLVLDAQFVGSLYLSGTLEADVLAVSLEKIEEDQLAQTVAGRAVRYAKKRSLASAAATHVVNWRDL
jgi:hypothetical protein